MAKVTLISKELGQEREFDEAHANRLLKYQETKGYNHWEKKEANGDTPANTDSKTAKNTPAR